MKMLWRDAAAQQNEAGQCSQHQREKKDKKEWEMLGRSCQSFLLKKNKKINKQAHKPEPDKNIQLLFGFWGNAVCKWSTAALSWR